MRYYIFIILLVGLYSIAGIPHPIESNSDKINLLAQKKVKINYNLIITVDSGRTDFPKFVNVSIKNAGEEVKIKNFVISIYYKDGGFWCVSEDFRFLDHDLVLQKGQTLKKNLLLNSLAYTDFNSKKNVDFAYVKNKLVNLNTWIMRASINDFRLFNDPLSSSDLVYSNSVEIKNRKSDQQQKK